VVSAARLGGAAESLAVPDRSATTRAPDAMTRPQRDEFWRFLLHADRGPVDEPQMPEFFARTAAELLRTV